MPLTIFHRLLYAGVDMPDLGSAAFYEPTSGTVRVHAYRDCSHSKRSLHLVGRYTMANVKLIKANDACVYCFDVAYKHTTYWSDLALLGGLLSDQLCRFLNSSKQLHGATPASFLLEMREVVSNISATTWKTPEIESVALSFQDTLKKKIKDISSSATLTSAKATDITKLYKMAASYIAPSYGGFRSEEYVRYVALGFGGSQDGYRSTCMTAEAWQRGRPEKDTADLLKMSASVSSFEQLQYVMLKEDIKAGTVLHTGADKAWRDAVDTAACNLAKLWSSNEETLRGLDDEVFIAVPTQSLEKWGELCNTLVSSVVGAHFFQKTEHYVFLKASEGIAKALSILNSVSSMRYNTLSLSYVHTVPSDTEDVFSMACTLFAPNEITNLTEAVNTARAF